MGFVNINTLFLGNFGLSYQETDPPLTKEQREHRWNTEGTQREHLYFGRKGKPIQKRGFFHSHSVAGKSCSSRNMGKFLTNAGVARAVATSGSHHHISSVTSGIDRKRSMTVTGSSHIGIHTQVGTKER